MEVSWLFESDKFGNETKRLVAEVRRQGMTAEIAEYVPLRSGQTYLDIFPAHACVIFYGSLVFADQIRDEATWTPGVYYNKTAFNCTSYYPHLGEFLLAEKYIMAPFGNLPRPKDFLYNTVSEEDTIFVRPNSGGKIFTGQTVEWIDICKPNDDFLNPYGVIPPDELCVVSAPRNITDEWRYVVVDQKVITGSQYIENDRRLRSKAADPLAFDLAQRVAAKYNPDRAWCIDICKTSAGNYCLLEIGCFSCAGLYQCEIEPIVREVSRAALEDWIAYDN